MRFLSMVTPKGNSSYSYLSQKEANTRAKQLDENGCIDCINCIECIDCINCIDCTSCSNCSKCSSCSNCINCIKCYDCSNCIYSYDCSKCIDCINCIECIYCSKCFDCSRCSGEIIQAGMPNGWRCYGHLIDNKLVIRCGCRTKSASEALAYWANKPDRTEVLAAVKYIINIALLKGWTLE